LVDLGPSDEPVAPQLVITETLSDPIQYATLSHRWGSANVFQLKLGNVEALRKEIPIDKLSKTFRDAFVAAKKLDVRYIWIDSLCIIQDSPDDWQREAALMQHVYSNARFNISATGAEDSDAGLFFDRGPLAVVPFTFEIPDTRPRERKGRRVGWRPGRYHLVDPSIWYSNISQAPLNARGWVMQERLLARRIVHFCRDQIFFECHEWEACELFPRGVPGTRTFRVRDTQMPWYGRFKSLTLGQRRQVQRRRWMREIGAPRRADPDIAYLPLWGELVETYSALALTKPEDKLTAFSGIAKLTQQRPEMSDDVYLAGLWRRHLPYHLLWTRGKPFLPRVREGGDCPISTKATTYIAPSWSWASVQSPVTVHFEPFVTDNNDEILVEVLEAEVDASGEDITGSVSGGYIKLKGFLRNAGCVVHPNGRGSLTTASGVELPDTYVWMDETGVFREGNCKRESVYCLPIRMWRTPAGDWPTEGLILKQMDLDPGVFERVGRFSACCYARVKGYDAGESRGFYGVGVEVWERKGVSAKAVMRDEAATFSEGVITLQ
jgi:hypothetical protein